MIGTSAASARRTAGLLGLLVFAHVGIQLWWMRTNGFFERPLTTDAAWHRLNTAPIFDALATDGVGGWIRAGLAHDHAHPPLMHMTAALCALPFGDVTPESIAVTLALFSGLFVVGTFRFARNFLQGGPAVGVAALTACCPVAALTFRAFYPHAPMAALVVWALDALVRSRFLASFTWTLAFGLLAGLATLAKQIAPIYLGGATIAALVIGLRTAPSRSAVLRNALIGLLAAGAVVSPWYLAHFGKAMAYASQVVGAEGQTQFSKGVSFDSFERWAYYPMHFAQSGLGFILSAAVMAALVWRLRRGGSAANAGLFVTTVVSIDVVLTLGQVAAKSAYVVNLAPLAMTLLGCAVAAMRPSAARRSVIGALLATAIVNAVMIYRPLEDDRPLGRIGDLALIPELDIWVGEFAREVGGRGTRVPEAWPVAEYAHKILATARRPVPHVAESSRTDPHPYVFQPNVEFAAMREGRRLDWRTLPDVRGVDPAKVLAALADVDYLILDERRFALQTAVAALTALRIPHAVLSEDAVTPVSKVSLVAIWRPWEQLAIQPRRVVDEPSVRRVKVSWDNGWRLVGVRTSTHPGDVVAMESFWECDARATPGQQASVVLFRGSTRLDGNSEDLVPPPAGSVLVISTAARSEDPRRDGLTFAVRTRRRAGTTESDNATVLDSDQPKRGRSTVAITP